MNGLYQYEQGKEFQVAAQMREGKCFGSVGGRVVVFSMHRHRQCTGCVRWGQRRKEGVCEYREEQLVADIKLPGSSPEMSDDKIKHQILPCGSD